MVGTTTRCQKSKVQWRKALRGWYALRTVGYQHCRDFYFILLFNTCCLMTITGGTTSIGPAGSSVSCQSCHESLPDYEPTPRRNTATVRSTLQAPCQIGGLGGSKFLLQVAPQLYVKLLSHEQRVLPRSLAGVPGKEATSPYRQYQNFWNGRVY